MSYRLVRKVTRTKTKNSCRCDWCGKTIEKGERYVNEFAIYDGSPLEWRSHDYCHEWAEALVVDQEYYYGDALSQYSLIEALEDFNREENG